MEEVGRKRFLWGVGLAWAPWVPVFIGLAFSLVDAFKGVSEQKATGLGAVAGGLSEIFAIFGLVVALAFEVSALVLLVRALSRENWLRSVFSLFSICLSGLMILLVALMLWFWVTKLPPAP